MSQTFRKCLTCSEIKDKALNFTIEEWKCNACARNGSSAPAAPSTIYPSTATTVSHTSNYAHTTSATRPITPPRQYTVSPPHQLGQPGYSAPAGVPDEDLAHWKKLFNYIDEDRSGKIGRDELQFKMAKMLGSFSWEDDDADGVMDFYEFVECMNKLNPNTRYSALAWAKSCLSNDGATVKKATPIASTSATRGRTTSTPQDKVQWEKLFRFIDEDGSGSISKYEIEQKMSKMLGKFDWEDEDANGTMDFEEFVETMDKLNPNTRYTALVYAKQCLK